MATLQTSAGWVSTTSLVSRNERDTHFVTTEVIPHRRTFCLVANRPIRKQDRQAGAICPFCPVQLPPKNRRMLVTVGEDDNVISFELSPKQPLWKLPLFIALVVLCVLMIIAAIVGQSIAKTA